MNLRNCEGLGRHQRQQKNAAAADQAMQVKEGPPANGGERGSEKMRAGRCWERGQQRARKANCRGVYDTCRSGDVIAGGGGQGWKGRHQRQRDVGLRQQTDESLQPARLFACHTSQTCA